MPRTAHFDAEYANSVDAPRRPATDEILMMEPPPAAFIGSTTDFIPRYAKLVDAVEEIKGVDVGIDEFDGFRDCCVVDKHIH